jgi:integrase
MKRATKSRKNSQTGAVKLREKELSNGHKSLYLDIYDKGKRSYEFLKLYLTGNKVADTETYRLAETIRAQRELEVKGREYGVVPNHVRQADFVAYFREMGEGKHLSWRSTLRHLQAFTGGTITFEQMTPEKVEGFKQYLLATAKLEQNTAYLYFAKLKAAIKRATNEGRFRRSPLLTIEGIKPKESERTFLTIEELRKLQQIECPNPETKRAFLFACYTGLRLSDVRGLTWNNIRDGRIEFRQQKTGKVEHVPLNAQALSLLGEPNGREHVFKLPATTNINQAIVRWAQRAGVTKELSFHVSRHTFATLALTYGADLYTVSKLLGHSDVRTTQIYAKIVDEKKREAVELLPTL